MMIRSELIKNNTVINDKDQAVVLSEPTASEADNRVKP